MTFLFPRWWQCWWVPASLCCSPFLSCCWPPHAYYVAFSSPVTERTEKRRRKRILKALPRTTSLISLSHTLESLSYKNLVKTWCTSASFHSAWYLVRTFALPYIDLCKTYCLQDKQPQLLDHEHENSSLTQCEALRSCRVKIDCVCVVVEGHVGTYCCYSR